MKIHLSKSLLTTALISLAFVINAQVKPVNITPEPGFVKDGIHEVVLNYSPIYSEIRFSPDALKYYSPDESVDKTNIICFSGDEIEQSPDMYSARIEGSSVIFTTKETWAIPGKYYLRLPEGALIFTTEDGTETKNPFTQYNWYIADFPNPVMSPESGDITDINSVSISITAEGFIFDRIYSQAIFMPGIFLCDADGNKLNNTPVARYTKLEKNDPDNPTLLTYSSPKTTTYPSTEFKPENGQYYLVTVIHNAVSVKNTSTDESQYIAQDLSKVYQYRENASTMFDYTLAPTDLSEMKVSEFDKIKISVPEDLYDSIVPNLDDIEGEGLLTAYLINGEVKISLSPEAGSGYYDYYLVPSEKLSAGKWTLIIPANYFFVEKEDSHGNISRIYNPTEITASYILTEDILKENLSRHIALSIPSALECNKFNARQPLGTGFGVVSYQLSTKEITVNRDEDIDILLYYEDNLAAKASCRIPGNGGNAQVYIQNMGAIANDELIEFDGQNTLWIVFSYKSGDVFGTTGAYRVVIPDDALMYNGIGMKGCEFIYHYTGNAPSGKAEIEIEEAECYNVYGVDGKIVMQSAAKSDLHALPEGFYIINGKKTIITRP